MQAEEDLAVDMMTYGIVGCAGVKGVIRAAHYNEACTMPYIHKSLGNSFRLIFVVRAVEVE